MGSLLLPLNSSALDLSPGVIRAHANASALAASVMDPNERLGSRSWKRRNKYAETVKSEECGVSALLSATLIHRRTSDWYQSTNKHLYDRKCEALIRVLV